MPAPSVAVTVIVDVPAGVPPVAVPLPLPLPVFVLLLPPQAVIRPRPASNTTSTSIWRVRASIFFLRIPAPAASRPGSQKAPASSGIEFEDGIAGNVGRTCTTVPEGVVLTVNVTVCATVLLLEVNVAVEGLKLHAAPAGSPLVQLSFTVPA